MAAVPTLDELLSTIPPPNRRQLDSKIDSDIHLEEIGKVLVVWERVRPYLGLSEAEEEAIKRDSFGVERERVGVLRKWRERFGPYATYRNLAKSFYDAGRPELVEAVCSLINSFGVQHQTQETQPRGFKARPPNLMNVVTELTDYSGWYMLGIGLEVPKTTLDKIHTNSRNGFCTVKRCKIEMVESWLQNAENPTWAALVAALKAIGRTGLAKRIAKKYGVTFDHLPISRDIISARLKAASCTSEQYSMITSLQSDTAVKDKQLFKVEEQEENLVKHIERITEELTELREQMQFNEQHTSMILSDSRLLKMELTKREEQVRNLQQQNERYKSLQQTEMLQVELKKNEQTLDAKRREVEQLKEDCRKIDHKLAATNEETRKLRKRIAHMQSRFDSLAKEHEEVCSERESLKEKLQKHDQEIDQKMLEFMSVKHPEQQEVEYYNVMVYAGRVEVKLRESEVEMLHHQLEVKRDQVDLLMKQVQACQQKSLDVVKQSKDEMGSSTYAYAYCSGERKDPTTSAFEKHITEQMMNQLAAENLQYKIRLAAEEAVKKQLQHRLDSLKRDLKHLRQVQSNSEAQQSLYSSRQEQQHQLFSPHSVIPSPSHVVPQAVPRSAKPSDSSEHNSLAPPLSPKQKSKRELRNLTSASIVVPKPLPESAECSGSSEHGLLIPPVPPKRHQVLQEPDSRHSSPPLSVSNSPRPLDGPPVRLDKHPVSRPSYNLRLPPSYKRGSYPNGFSYVQPEPDSGHPFSPLSVSNSQPAQQDILYNVPRPSYNSRLPWSYKRGLYPNGFSYVRSQVRSLEPDSRDSSSPLSVSNAQPAQQDILHNVPRPSYNSRLSSSYKRGLFSSMQPGSITRARFLRHILSTQCQ